MLNIEAINKLVELNKNNIVHLDFIMSCIDSFEQYHKAVFDDQMLQVIYKDALDSDEYRERRTSLDKTRTIKHSSVISSVSILNRFASKAGIEPVYDGVVSEERPYRREIANAVFEYVEYIIKNRV